MMEEAFKHLSRQEIFEQTGGIQFLSINTLYQMLSMVVNKSPQLEIADTFLMMPDLFNYWLSGRKVVNLPMRPQPNSINSLNGDWSDGVLEKSGHSHQAYSLKW